MRRIQRSRAGIAEVVGAMLLIIITVVAISAFAFYLNSTQQAAQSRQSFINSVKNENLALQHIQLFDRVQIAQKTQCYTLTNAMGVGTCAFPLNVLEGDLVVVGLVDPPSTPNPPVTVQTITDSASPTSNIYSLIGSARANSQSLAGDAELWSAEITNGGTLTVTVTWTSATVMNVGIILYDLNDAKGSGFSSSSGSSTSAVTPSFVSAYTPKIGSMIIGVIDSSTYAPVKYGSYTLDTHGGTGFVGASEHFVPSTGASETTPFNLTTADNFNEVSVSIPSSSSLIDPISNLTITIQNQNTLASSLVHIQVDGTYVSTFYAANQNYTNGLPLTIPAKESVKVLLNGSSSSLFDYSSGIYRNQSLQIVLLSGAGNYFETVYDPPSSIITEQLGSEVLTVASASSSATTTVTTTTTETTTSTTTIVSPPTTSTTTITSTITTTSTGYTTTTTNTEPALDDVPIFSGQQSQGQNNTFIQGYFWTFSYQSSGQSFTFSSSPSVAYRASFVKQFNNGILPLDFQGPFKVSLMVEDANGFIFSSSFTFPMDPNILPNS